MSTEHRILHPDGRTLAVLETGPADGPVVVLCHAAPGSRAFDPNPEATTAAGVRLIALDRAGYGASSPLPENELPTVAGYAADVAVVLDELGVTRAAVAGWSAGGRVAAALAANRPELVSSLAVIATPAPHEAVAWIPDEQMAMIESMRDVALSATTQMTPAFAEMANDPSGAVGSVSGSEGDDAALAAEPWRRERLEAMLVEAFAQGAIGLAADIVSYTLAPWGENVASVSCPTTAWYGAGDPVVTPAHGEWYLSQVGGKGDLTVVPDIGHLVVMTNWADILAALA